MNKGISAGDRARISALFCSLTLVLAALCSRPFVEMGVNDDWSYIRSAFHVAQTGKIAYYGWSEPILGWQLYWSALFLRVFGFSFNAPRLSMLLVAGATIYLIHRVLVRLGIEEFNATIGTMVFALSPVFLPLSYSYMSDVGGLFAIVVCLHFCVRSHQAATERDALIWLSLALAGNLVLGTARQVAWLGALVMVPSGFALLPNGRRYLWRALLGWLGGLALILLCVEWFQRQPFTQYESPLRDIQVHPSSWLEAMKQYVHFALTVPLLLLPVLIAFVTRKWIHDRRSRFVAVLGAIFLCAVTLMGFYIHRRRSLEGWLAPYLGNYFTAQGVLDIPAIGARPTVLNFGVRASITFLLVAGIVAIVACVVGGGSPPDSQMDAVRQKAVRRAALILLMPFTMCYCLLLVPRGLAGSLFDRYLLPLLVVALISLLLLHQRYVGGRLPAVSLALLLVIGTYSICSMHDFYAMERARLAAVDELRAAGTPSTSFYGGFEYDGWTQIESWGYFMSPHLKLPPGSAHSPAWSLNAKPCGYFFARMLPAIRPEYALSYDPNACQGPSHFSPVEYRTWLPPHTGHIYIQSVSIAGSN